jgi:integrase
MSRRPVFKVSKSAKKGWSVNVPASLSSSGLRERHYFKTRDKALEMAVELRQTYHDFGVQAVTITPTLAEAAIQAQQRLKPYKLTLSEAINDYLSILTAREGSVTLREGARRWLATKTRCRQSTLKSYAYTIKRLAPLADRIMAEITAEDVEGVIEASTTVFEGHRRNARALFEYGARRGWCPSGLLKSIERRSMQSAETTTLTPAEVRNVMEAAEKHYPETVSAFAVAIFAGVRMAELERLRWRDVHADGIEVSSATAKKRRRRFLPMNPTLAAWLAGRRPDNASEFVVPANWHEKSKGVRRLAGFKVVARILSDPPKLPKEAPMWPQNAMRHTHASAAIANGVSLDELIFAFGHTGTPEMLKSHYVGMYRPNDAVAFWSIGPEGQVIQTTRAA